MISVFDFDDYKVFVVERIRGMPQRGRGEFQRLAMALQMHTTSVSQVFKGDKELTLEQAARLCTHWGLTELESDCFLTLVELNRAGAPELQRLTRQRLAKIKDQSNELRNRIPKDRVLSDADRYQFYSQWYFSATRMLCDLPEIQNVDQIAQHLKLPRATIQEVVQFLIDCGLVVEDDKGLKMGPKRTFLPAASLLVNRHHSNWRQKVTELYGSMQLERDLVITSPMTISEKDAAKVRQILLECADRILKINSESPSEEMRVLNIDWLRV